MNFARHLLRRPASTSVAALVRPIILPTTVPLNPSSTPIPLINHIVPRLRQVAQQPQQKRLQSTAIGPISGSVSSSSAREVKPSYDLTFTCRPCGKRSTHNVSKQGYHYGSVLITCPGCHNRHVISDHLKVCYAPFYTDIQTGRFHANSNRSSARPPAPSMKSSSSRVPGKRSTDTPLPNAATRSSSVPQTPCVSVESGVRAVTTLRSFQKAMVLM